MTSQDGDDLEARFFPNQWKQIVLRISQKEMDCVNYGGIAYLDWLEQEAKKALSEALSPCPYLSTFCKHIELKEYELVENVYKKLDEPYYVLSYDMKGYKEKKDA